MRSTSRNLALLVVLAVVVVGGAVLRATGVVGNDGGDSSSSSHALAWVDESALPPEARETIELIDDGGPFPYEQDGAVFSNFEGHLPDEPHGYYHEYTVVTPGESDRGARRIISGADGQLYWTEDH